MVAGSSVPTPPGLVLAPFTGLRYADNRLNERTSPPYDVIDEAGVQRYEAADPHNVVRLILPRDEPDHPGSRYARAAGTLAQWRAEGGLVPDMGPALYVYEEADGTHRQRGLVGALALLPADAGVVLPHENTMAAAVADRLALTEATEANLEPIFLVYEGGGAASAAVAAVDTRPLLAAADTEDGVSHRLWAITDADTFAEIAADLRGRRAVIADGHHRYATYLHYQTDRHRAGAGPGPWDYGLAYLVDATAFGPQVHPIHRVVPGLRLETASERARTAFAVTEMAGSVADALAALGKARMDGTAFLLSDGDRHALLTAPDAGTLVRALPADRSAAWRELDVSVLHYLLVREVWRLDDDEQAVGYAHDVAEALTAARRTGGTAVLLVATPLASVMAVAAAGERMPRKSTLFTPKPRTGLVMRDYRDQA